MAPTRNGSTPRSQLTTELGDTGLARTGGVPREEYLRELQGPRGMKALREMRHDPICGAMMTLTETKLRATPYTLEPPADPDTGAVAPQAEQAAEFVSQALEALGGWDDHLAEVVDEATYGFALFEIVYERRDGRLTWAKFAPRAQTSIDRWEFDEHGTPLAAWQQPEIGHQVRLPLDKMLHYRTSRRLNDPQGHSLLRLAYRPWYFRKRLEEVEAIGYERDATGVPLIRIPGKHIKDDPDGVLASWTKVGEELRQDERAYVMVPSDRDPTSGEYTYIVELMSSPGQGRDPQQAIERWARWATVGILADVMLIGHEAVGSHALAEAKIDLLDNVLQSVADQIAETFTSQGIRTLTALNGIPAEHTPKLKAGEVGKLTLSETAEYAERLAKAGLLLPDPELERHLRDRAGFPDADTEQL